MWLRSPAFLLTAAAGMLGLAVVGLLVLYPPDVAHSAFKAWNYLDKRWIIALYLLCVGLVYLPGILQRVLAPAGSRSRSMSGRNDFPEARQRFRTWPTNTVVRAFLATAAGSVMAVLYVVPLIPGTVERRLDTHELVHLGGIQRIAQGARPYLEARTQYGPGHQFVSYKLMQKTEFTVRGFRVAHMVINLFTVGLFLSIILFAFGWTTGAAIACAALLVSPLQTTSFVGWGVLVRWFAPFVVGVWAPAVLWRTSTAHRQRAGFALMGATCGVLAWFSQENASTSVVALLLVLAAAIIRRDVPIRAALLLLGIFGVAELATLLGLLAWLVGLPHLGEAFALYRSAGTLVFAGMTNASWSMTGSAWSRPSPTWTLAFFLTPCVIVVLAAVVLYFVRPASTVHGDVRMGQLLGMIGAAASLHVLTLLRSDAVHFIGSSTAIAPLVVLSVVYLPERLFWQTRHRVSIARTAMVLVFIVIYPFLWSAPEFKVPPLIHLEELYQGAQILNEVRRGRTSNPGTDSRDTLAQRLGFEPPADDRCCNIKRCCKLQDLTYGDWSRAFQEIRSAIGDRTVYVDTLRNASAFGEVASAVYFFGDLKVATAFVEPMMSVWVDEDLASAKEDLRTHLPDCLVTGGRDFLMTQFVLDLYKEYSEFKTSGPVSATVYCGKRS